MIVNLLSIEALEKKDGFKFQNDSFKEWCEKHQDESFKVLEVYSDSTLRIKGYNFVLNSEYTNYKAKVTKQLRDETGYAMLDCKRALVNNNWNYEAAKEEIRKEPRGVLVDRWGGDRDWVFIHSDNEGNNEYLRFKRIDDYLN